MKNKVNVIIISLLTIIIIALSILYYNTYRNYNTPYIKKVTIFGNEIELLPNIYAYEIHMKNARVKASGNGCEIPYSFEVSSLHKKKFNETGAIGSVRYVDGEENAYFFFEFEKYDEDKHKVTRVDARYFFYFTFEEALVVDEKCQPSKSE